VGLKWALLIIFSVITARVLLFRFFLQQLHYQRKMQAMRLQEITRKYKDGRQAQRPAIMEQKEG
jgi:YidC/Oxa1 family membrane protein insertase